MVKLRVLIFFLLLSFGVSAQKIQKVNTYGYEYNRFIVDTLFALPADTFTVPSALQSYPFLAKKGSTLYLWNTSTLVWGSVSGAGSTPTWQQTLTAGSTLTGNNTALLSGNWFKFSGNDGSFTTIGAADFNTYSYKVGGGNNYTAYSQDYINGDIYSISPSGHSEINVNGVDRVIDIEAYNVSTDKTAHVILTSNGTNHNVKIEGTGGGRNSELFVRDTAIDINADRGNLIIDSLNYTLSTTRKKIMLRDTVTGLVENIDPALLVRGNISLTTTGSSGASTYNSGTGVFNIPVYTGGGGGDSLPVVNKFIVFDDSYGTGYPGYTPWDSLLATTYGATLDNQSVSARGVWEQVDRANSDAIIPNNNKSIVIPAAGLNDIRRNGGATKTINKIRNSYGSVFVNAFKKSTVNGANSVLTRLGFNFSYTAADLGGKYGTSTFPAVPNSTHAGLSNTLGDSLSYSFFGNNIAVQFMGNSGATETYSTQAEIIIDNVPVDTMNLNNQWDNVSDGSNDNRRGPVFWWEGGLTLGTHIITIKNLDGGYLPVDFFSVLNQPENCKPAIALNIPYLNTTGYAVSPALGTVANTDSANNAINAVVAQLAAYGYPVTFGSTNAFFDIGTSGDADSIHPNQAGHYEIRNAAKAALVSAYRPAYNSASVGSGGGSGVTSVSGTTDLISSTGGTDPVIGVGKNITLQYDTIPLHTFSMGNRMQRDTILFSDSTIIDAFFNDYTDTLVITKLNAVMNGGVSDTLGIQVTYNDSINVVGDNMFTDTLPINSTTTGTIPADGLWTGGAPPFKIPPGNWVWAKNVLAVTARKPYYLAVSLIGYKSRTIVETPSCYLLDNSFASSASAAYSLRQLRAAYAGSAIKVKRKSDGTESDIGFIADCGGLDTAALKTFVGTGGTDSAWITKWYDQSGNGNDAVQATAANQPQIVVGGVILRLNGNPAWEIIGQSQYIALTSAITTVRSGFMVYNSAATNSNNPSILGDVTANDFHGVVSNSLMYNTSFCSANITGGTHYVNNASYSAAGVPKATPQQLYSFSTSGNVTVGNISNDRISFSRSWLGRFQEVILYTTDKSASRASFETNINGYYGAY